jgi:hypothetical protein
MPALHYKSSKPDRDKKYLDAVLDVLPVYVFYTGFIMILLPYVPKIDKEAAASACPE